MPTKKRNNARARDPIPHPPTEEIPPEDVFLGGSTPRLNPWRVQGRLYRIVGTERNEDGTCGHWVRSETGAFKYFNEKNLKIFLQNT